MNKFEQNELDKNKKLGFYLLDWVVFDRKTSVSTFAFRDQIK